MIFISFSGFNPNDIRYMEGLLYNCISLISIELSHLFTKNVRNKSSMLYNCCSSLILQMWWISLDNSVYAIMDWNKITNKSTAQYRLREEYRKTKLDLFDVNGLTDIFSRRVIACIEGLLLCNVPLSLQLNIITYIIIHRKRLFLLFMN